MNGKQEGGVHIHWGCLILTIVLVVGSVIVFLALGWRWLWLMPAFVAAVYALMFINSVIEDRWLAVTPEHIRRGVPAKCSECDYELDVVISSSSFKTRCPICGHKSSGHFSDS